MYRTDVASGLAYKICLKSVHIKSKAVVTGNHEISWKISLTPFNQQHSVLLRSLNKSFTVFLSFIFVQGGGGPPNVNTNPG